jgi:hypothetical protein
MSKRAAWFRNRPRRTPEQKRVGRAIKSLTKYMVTYPKQHGYLDYNDETIINDVLYGLGRALDPEKYQFANGFDLFKEVLRKHLAK